MRKESSGHSKQCCTHKSGLNLKVPYFLKWASLVALVVKNPPARARNIRDAGSTPGLRRSPGGGCDNPLQYSCLENPMDRGTWWARVQRVTESAMTEYTHKYIVYGVETR